MSAEMQGDAYRAFEHAAWERAAAYYSDTFAAATRLFAEPLLDAVSCEPGQALLDVACGPGLVSSIAAARGAAVTGVDFSAAMVAEARRRSPSLRFEHSDAEALPFGDQTFDRVVCGFGVHHFPHPARAVAEAHRVLKSGGRFAFTVWASDDHVPQQLLVSTIRAHGVSGASLPSPPQGDINTTDGCLQLLQKAGFQVNHTCASVVRAILKVDSMSEVVTMMLKGTARVSALIQSQPRDAMVAILSGLEEAAAKYKVGQAYELPAAAILAMASKA